MPDPLEKHLSRAATAMAEGRVTPVLGAGVNRCGRPAKVKWNYGDRRYLPDGGELAGYLAERFEYPDDEPRELARVSQYALVSEGSGPLYDRLHEVFDHEYPPSPLHDLLAELPGMWRRKGYEPRYQLIVTTNYDDALERAFAQANEPFDLLTYAVKGPDAGRLVHRPPDGKPKAVKRPNQYPLTLRERTAILKIHGAVDRGNPDEDSYLIAEDDYIDFLSETSVSSLIPVTLYDRMQRSHLLFLGYSLRDWNVRVILRRIWGEQKRDYRAWSVQRRPNELEVEFWAKRDVDIYDVDLAEYVKGLRTRFHALSPAAPA